MARLAGVNLPAAVVEGWLSRNELATLVNRCQCCGQSPDCTGWLATARSAPLPDYCRNKGEIEALSPEHLSVPRGCTAQVIERKDFIAAFRVLFTSGGLRLRHGCHARPSPASIAGRAAGRDAAATGKEHAMTITLVQVDFPHPGPWADEMAVALDGLARSIADEPGFLFKYWTENRAEGHAGGIYAFASRTEAEAYLAMHSERLKALRLFRDPAGLVHGCERDPVKDRQGAGSVARAVPPGLRLEMAAAGAFRWYWCASRQLTSVVRKVDTSCHSNGHRREAGIRQVQG